MVGFVLLLGWLCAESDAATVQTVWSTNYPIGRAGGMVLDGSGSMYVTGSSPTTNSYPATLTLKIDRHGQVLWQSLYQSATNVNTPAQLLLDAETNLYVLGYSWSEEGQTDSFLLKYNPEGELLWERHRGPPYSYEEQEYTFLFGSRHMALDPLGNLIVNRTSAGTNGHPVLRTTKYSSGGQELWTAENESTQPIHVGRAVIVEPGGTVSVTCTSSNVITRLYYDAEGSLLSNIVYRFRLPTPFTAQPLPGGKLLAINTDLCPGWGIALHGPDGNEQWFRHYQGKFSRSYQLDPVTAFDGEGNLYVGGDVCNNGLCLESTEFDTFLLKFDPAGNRVWGNSFPAYYQYRAQPVAIRFDAEGNLYVGTMFYLLKYDRNGNRLWAVSTGAERLANFEVAPDGDIYLAGSKSAIGGERWFLARFAQPSTTNLARLDFPLSSQALRPNGVLELSASASADEPISYRWRLWGKTFFPFGTNATNATLVLTNFLTGEYNVELITSGGSVFSPWARVSYLPRLTNITWLSETQVSFTLLGEANAYTIEASSNLLHWSALTNLSPCGSGTIILDSDPSVGSFFRVGRDN
jgi:hypothetical protein